MVDVTNNFVIGIANIEMPAGKTYTARLAGLQNPRY